MSAEVKSMKEWALYYAELGLAVFPLAYRNKVPAIEGGCKAATTEKSKIERWWNQNPRYNIGIATGNKSNGLVVIDLDVDKNKGIDGYEVLRDWQNKHGELPETWQSITGRGGYHYFYKDTITHSNKVGLYEGVDIRGEGGYIVAPPSVHPNGNTYEWEQEPKEYEIAQVDDIVNDFFKGEKQRIDSEHKTNFKVPELIPEGKRVDTIVRLIASLRTKGLDDDAIKAAVRVENEKRCNPPLKEKELEKAVFPALKRDWQVNSPSGIGKAFTFSYDVTTPDGKRRWGKYSMNLPRVNTVPYLAKGAVIPPRSEFLAVLGDQKQGNNIETPEALLRKIVREETAGRQAGGGSYRFTAQINRRTLFDEMMKEAQMRRDTSGRNPFEMA